LNHPPLLRFTRCQFPCISSCVLSSITLTSILSTIAEVIGFTVLGFIALLVVVTVVVTTHDFIRARFPKYDLWLYDDNRRWNRRQRKRK
jgi:hypothetical protein